jgi:hypothetical protein
MVYKSEEADDNQVSKKQIVKETQYVDGRRMVIGGSSTRNEKNWQSTVFSTEANQS